jgi:CheY-like chemotaxis protein
MRKAHLAIARPKRTVLVIDDSDEVREALEFILANAGYVVETAAGAAEGLARMRAAKPSVVVLDLMMPDMDGFAFRCEQLADEQIRDVPVVVYSAAYDIRQMAAHIDAAAYVEKTREVTALLTAVRDCIRPPQGDPPSPLHAATLERRRARARSARH